MNKKLVIVLGVVAVLVGGAALFGFLGLGAVMISSKTTTTDSRDVSAPQVRVDQTTGVVTYKTEQGNLTLNGGSMPENWPADVPTAYAKAEIMSSSSKDPIYGTAKSSVIYRTKAANRKEVIDYYTKGLNASGWKIDASAELAGYWVITAKKDTRSFFAYISEADGYVGVTTGVGPKE
jgi:hypothetical protein